MSKKIEYDVELLKNMYLVQNMTAAEIGIELGFTETFIRKKCVQLGLKKTREQKLECFERHKPNITEETLLKRKKTCIERYGTDCVSKCDSIKEKIKQTCLEKYGSVSILGSKENREKWEEEREKKYRVKHPAQRQEVIEKMQQTCMEKYGVPNHSMLESHRKNMRLLSKSKDKDCDIELLEQTIKDRDSFRDFIISNNITSTIQLSEIFHVMVCTAERMIYEFDSWDLMSYRKSSGEIEIRDFIESLGVSTTTDRNILKPLEIDIYCPDYNIGIEYNGAYWHSSLYKDKNYHYNKSKKAAEAGVRLIHIYDYEWEDETKKEILKSFLKIAFGKVDKKIYARNCEVLEITNKDAKPFNDNNHLQGHKNAQITYGLFYNGILVQLMSFSKHKKYQWEIERGCPGSNNIVVGGVSKLFKHFLREKNPDSVFSYCDFNKFDGVGYEKIGMKFIGYTGPDMKWIIGGKVYNRSPSKHNEYKNVSEAQLWGAGSKKYLWKKEGDE